jgi:hypothetical protein
MAVAAVAALLSQELLEQRLLEETAALVLRQL